jgi:hypothetical protein
MSSFELISTILKRQNEDLLDRIATRFDKNKSELHSKYLRPQFYMPIREETAMSVTFVEKEAGLKMKDKNNVATNGRRKRVPPTPQEADK